MNIVVAGGTGLVGSAITTALLDAGHAVSVLSRSSSPRMDPRSRWVEGDVTRPDTLTQALTGAEMVVDAVQFPNSPIENPKKGYTFERIDLGGTRNLADAAVAAGVAQFIDISGGGAAADSPYRWRRVKWQEEQHIIATGLPYTIFRPTWIFSEHDVSLNRFLNFGNFLPFIPVIGSGKTLNYILFLGYLAAHVAAAAGNAQALHRTFDIGGPEVLTMDEIIRTALQVQGRRRLLIHQPKALMKLIGGVVQHLPGRPLTPDAIEFITMDGVADTAALQEVFGLPLTPLREGLARYLPRR
jgi:NADH dehydrogenase